MTLNTPALSLHSSRAAVQCRTQESIVQGPLRTSVKSESELFSDSFLDAENCSLSPYRSALDSSPLTSALLKWCNAISSSYGVHVHNFTTSLADGKALCYLVHYYHPSILRLNDIRDTTSSMINTHFRSKKEAAGGRTVDLELSQFTESSQLSGALSKSDIKRGLEGERVNFNTVQSACSSIGGIWSKMEMCEFIFFRE
jgi:Calponin homology (CH) domain